VEAYLHAFLRALEMSGQLHASSDLTPGKDQLIRIKEGNVWAPARVLTLWRRWEFLASVGNQTRFLGRPSRSLVSIPTELSQLL